MAIPKAKCIIIIILSIIISSISNSTTLLLCDASKDAHHDQITSECGFTRYPTLCAQTLRQTTSNSPPNVNFLSALINKTFSDSTLPSSNFEILSSHFISPEAQHARLAMDNCHELMEMSRKKLSQALEALRESPTKNKLDIQTWLSAALTYQETCKESVEGHVSSNVYMNEIHKKMKYLSELGSNPLALANRITGPIVPHKRILGEDRFPSWLTSKERRLLQSAEIRANVVVAKDGSGDFETVSEAIEAAHGGRFVIYVKAGTYNERISTNKDGITLIGDGKYSTIITGNGNVAKGYSLLETATFTIKGDRFIARDIGFQNTAGPDGEQAIALTVASDNSVLYRCSILGYQDTLYALSLRQFYRECDIYGSVDFIFGNAAAVFQSCTLVLRRPRTGGYDVILANGRTDPGQNTGFSLQSCRITVGSDFRPVRSFLGRPWKEFSRAVVMESNIDGAIDSRGWVEWPGSGGSTYKNLYFAEYGNMGPGSGVSGRVRWPGFRVIEKLEAGKFTVGNFIGGNSWLPSTGVTFVSGL